MAAAAGIPVIPCTSKTAEEVREFRAAAQLNDHIVENGSAIHGSSETGEDWEEALGFGWTVEASVVRVGEGTW